MPWIQLKLNTTGTNAEELSDALMEAGSVSITFQIRMIRRYLNLCRARLACGVIPTLSACSMQKPT